MEKKEMAFEIVVYDEGKPYEEHTYIIDGQEITTIRLDEGDDPEASDSLFESLAMYFNGGELNIKVTNKSSDEEEDADQ